MMNLRDDKTGLAVLDRAACLEKLAGSQIGRLGVVESSHPIVLPINYVLDGDAPVMATVEGVKSRSSRGRPACLEVDHIDPDRQTGWSVLVRGRLEDVSHDREVLARIQPPVSWAPGEHPVILRLVPFSITGRVVGS